MKFLDRFFKKKEEEENPWITKTLETVTDEDITEAIEHMKAPKTNPRYLPMFLQLFIILWGVGHFAILYVMINSPINGGILVYVLISLMLYSHYFVLLNKERKQ